MKHFFLLLTALVATTTLRGAADFLSIDFKVDGIVYVTLGGDSVGVQSANGLDSVILPATVTYQSTTYRVTSIGESAFDYSLVSITLPNSMTSISEGAFDNCSSLTSVTIPNSVTSIGDAAFAWCISLTSITLPNSVTTIGNSVFSNCYALSSVNIPNSVTKMGYGVFGLCTSLQSITIPNSVTRIDNTTFATCTSLTSVTLPNSLTSIGSYAFASCTSLKTITIPNSVTCIGDSAFLECYSLQSIAIPDSVISIGKGAFKHCIALKSATIGNSLTCISYEAFDSCDSLQSVTIGNSVTSIGESAFGNCRSLKTVTLGNNVTSIGMGAFINCHALYSINLPNSVTSIGESAFGCCGFTSFIFPRKVTCIETATLMGCTSLKTITIPNGVTSIGEKAFYYCSAITSITCYAATPPTCGTNCFTNVSKTASIYVPTNSISDYQTADGWKYFTKYIKSISAQPVSTTTVTVTTGDYTATIFWPTTPYDETYIVEIKKGGELFCTLTFNEQGKLLTIAYAPGRGTGNDITTAEAVAEGYKFTITGLDPGTTYTYSVVTKNDSDVSIASYTGSFTTTGTPTALDETSFPAGEEYGVTSKFIRDGRLLIRQNGHSYTATGQELR